MTSDVPRPSRSDPPDRRERSPDLGTLVLLIAPLLVLAYLYFGRAARVPHPSAPPRAAATPAMHAPVRATASMSAPRISESSEALPFGGLREPRDAAVDERGRLWVADFGNSRLRIYGHSGKPAGGWGSRGDGPYEFRDPCGVAISRQEVYVADTWNGRILWFTLAGEWKGTAPGLVGPRGVAVSPDGTVWAADTGSHRIAIFDRALAPRGSVGRKGSAAGEFENPVGLAVGPSRTVYVADSGNRRVVLLDPDGRFRTAWHVPGWERPVEPHIEVDDAENVYVSDPGSAEEVLRYDRSGRISGRLGAEPEGRRFSLPSGLAIDRRAKVLYVVNRGNGTISVVPLSAFNAR